MIGNWDDKDFVLEAVKYNGGNLYFCSDRLKDDDEIVLAAVNEDGSSLQFASDRLKNDEKIALTAIKTMDHYNSLSAIGEKLKDDKKFILSALNHWLHIIMYASNRLKHDASFCLECAKKNSDVIPLFKGAVKELFQKNNNDLVAVAQALALSQQTHTEPVLPESNLPELLVQFKTIKAEYHRLETALQQAQQQITQTLKG